MANEQTQTLKQCSSSLSLNEYEGNFIEEGFKTMETVRLITHEQQLKDIGIDKLADRLKIMNSLNISTSGTVQTNFVHFPSSPKSKKPNI